MKFETKLNTLLEDSLLEQYSKIEILEAFIYSDIDNYDEFINESLNEGFLDFFKSVKETLETYLDKLSKKDYKSFSQAANLILDPNNKEEIFKLPFVTDKITYQKLIDGIKVIQTKKSAAYAGSEDDYYTSPQSFKKATI